MKVTIEDEQLGLM
jgi:hypothetical protein